MVGADSGPAPVDGLPPGEGNSRPDRLLRGRVDRVVGLTFLAGLLVRLVVMPFTAHSDLLHMAWIGSRAAYGFEFTYRFQTVLIALHAGYLRLVSFLLPYFDRTWVHSEAFRAFDFQSAADWYNFISIPQIQRDLFVFKLLYLAFDLGCAALVLRLAPKGARSRTVFAAWWLNPILIFAVYVFGRHEVITLFFILLSLWLIRRERWGWGLLSLGVAVAIRYYALLLLPFYVLSGPFSLKKRLALAGLGLVPWLAANLVSWAAVGSPEGVNLAAYQPESMLFAMKIGLAAWDNLYVFPLLYLLLLLHRIYNRQVGLPTLRQYSLISLLVLFATAYVLQYPHYWTWLLPFLVLEIGQDRRLLPLHVVQILCLFVYSFIDGRSTAGYLFAPLAPDFFWSLPSPLELLRPFVPSETVISLARTAFSAVSLWMAYLVLRRLPTRIPLEEEAAR